jgi:hypothetical protein
MTLQIPAPMLLPEEIYSPLEIMCIEAVELSPAGKELYAQRDELLAAIEKLVPRKVHSDLSDLFMAYACEYGGEMLKLGLMIGHDPSLLFEIEE